MLHRGVVVTLSVLSFTWIAAAGAAHAGGLQSVQDCVPGARVVTSDGHSGSITRIDSAWSYCYVRQDDTGSEVGYLYSLLQPAGAPASGEIGSVGDNQLAPGVYECFADGQYTFMDMRITGPATYQSAGLDGGYHIEPSGKIVFETGPLAPYFSKLVPGHRIGLNSNGDQFYATTCELNPNRR